MAPPSFPNKIPIEAIGIATFKYPDVAPPPFNIPLGNIVGAMQYASPQDQNNMIAQLASRYLEALLAYQTSDEPTLHNPSDPQYYFSTALCLLNFLCTSPDVCKRTAAHPTLFNSVVEKMLAPDFEKKMKAAPRTGGILPPPTFDDQFGSVLQFVSTILLYKAEMQNIHPRIEELIPKLRIWKRTYKNSRTKTISSASDRLVDQIQGMDPAMIMIMRKSQERALVCGVISCTVRDVEQLTLCSTCKIQRYCGRDHQKADWKYHKHICNKGLNEVAALES